MTGTPEDFDLDDLKEALESAAPRPDPDLRAAHLRLAQENFDRIAPGLRDSRQGSSPETRPTSTSPMAGLWKGVKDMLTTLNPKGLTGRGGLTATTAIVACGFLFLSPQGQDLLRGNNKVGEGDVPRVASEPAVQPEGGTQQDAVSIEAAEAAIDAEADRGALAEPVTALTEGLDLAEEVMPFADAATLADDLTAAPERFAAAPPQPPVLSSPALRSRDEVSGFAVTLAPEATDSFANASDNPVRVTMEHPVSTFSIDVDTASYSIIRRSLNAGQLPPRDAVRIEEMVNYFPYDYPAPEMGEEAFRPTVNVFQTPWNPDTQLVHIGLQGTLPAIEDRPPLNLVFLIDTSGSMDRPDRLPLVKQSFRLLLDQLRPEDQVAIVEYAGSTGLALPPTPASDRAAILKALGDLGAGGSTNGQGGLEQAYATAAEMLGEGEIARVILATDGDFNVGATGAEAMTDFIAARRDSGIYLSVLGFGMGNLQDATMQALAQNGNGTAAYIDTLNEAQKVLVDQLTGTLFPIAGDVKVQVEFNPAAIAEYRLIGYETRALNREDFANDRVDAGDLGAGHSVTALYEVTPVDSPARLTDPLRYGAAEALQASDSEELGFLRLRWKAPGEEASRLIEMPILPGMGDAGTDAQFAAAIAGFGQILRGTPFLGDWGWDEAIALAAANRGEDPFGYRTEAVQLMRLAQSLSGD